jgi:hypothetical protein
MDLKEIVSKYDGDVILYFGGITREGYGKISDILEKKTKKSNKICLIIGTLGGNPDAAFRIARAIKHHYKKKHFDILIPDMCKSAGTLLCIGADSIIIGDRGELGPLDIQLSKPDEIFENMSGLDIVSAISSMENELLSAFKRYLLDLKTGASLSTKIASDIATELSDSLISPIMSRIDPLTLGQHQRAIQIAMEYGERLNKMSESLKPGALIKLITDYPCHGFVIDRREARNLFKNVQYLNEQTIELYNFARTLSNHVGGDPIVIDLGADDETDSDSSQGSDSNKKDSSRTNKKPAGKSASSKQSNTNTNTKKPA